MGGNGDGTIARQRSVDNLQRLYTVVIALALTKAVELLVGSTRADASQTTPQALLGLVSSPLFPLFAALILTIAPFYHGANRFLDVAYVFNTEPAKPVLNMVDFTVFFVQALLFLLMALSLKTGWAFFGWFLCLLVVDILWAFLVVWSTGRDSTGAAKRWGWLNLAAFVAVLFLLSVQFTSDDARFLYLSVLAIVRTVLDYALSRKIYWAEAAATA